MTTEAQISANRSNAQKSTGPRTPEGKATVAQNAVKHGLLAQEVVIKGEDPGEFELYRDGMLEELAPAGLMESMLAERIVSLSWRLRRAERLQVAAFDRVEEKNEPLPVLDHEDAAWLLERIVERGIRIPPPAPEGPFGRGAVQDFNQERVLDRLLMYERRIEHSLYRTMAELRKLRKEGGVSSVKWQGASENERVKCEISSLKLENPASTSPGLPSSNFKLETAAEPSSCETKPIDEEVSSLKCQVSSEQGQAASPPSLPTSNLTLETAAQPPSCETKPICAGAKKDQFGYRPIFRRRR